MHRKLISLFSRIVPRRFRSDWKQEWDSELRHREAKSGPQELTRRSLGAFWDALAMQPRRLEEEMFQDLRHGLRMLWKNPGFTLVAVLSLAVGIGANTAVFSVVDALMFRNLPVKHPSQLVLLTEKFPQGNNDAFSYPLYERFRETSHEFSGLAASAGSRSMRMLVAGEGNGEPEPVKAEMVSGNYFVLLGVDAALGRTLTEDDDRAVNPAAVAVISYGFWQTRFAGDRKVIGQQIILNRIPFTIVGVAAKGFHGTTVGVTQDMWWPLRVYPQTAPGDNSLTNPGNAWLQIFARLQPGANVIRARAGLDLVHQQMLSEMAAARAAQGKPAASGNIAERHLALAPAGTGSTFLRAKFQQPMLILGIIVGLVLLIACANVANLLLARANTRRRELAVRLAIGGSRFRLVRQLLTESASLGLFGALVGLLIAFWGTRVLLGYLPPDVNLNVQPDSHVLGFTLGISVLSSLLFGLIPAFHATRLDVNPALKNLSGSSGRHHSRSNLNKSFVVSQVSLSLVLLVVAGLFVNTLRNLNSLDLGFDRQNIILFSLDAADYKPLQRIELYRQLVPRLEALPGVRSASLSSFGLLSNNNYSEMVKVDGFQDASCSAVFVGPAFFETTGVPLLIGRGLSPEDQEAGGQSIPVVISQTMATFYFGDQNPIGRHFRTSRFDAEIVGVAKDSRYRDLREPARRVFYLPLPQQNNMSLQIASSAAVFELRSAIDPRELAGAIRETVRELDPKLRVNRIQTMDEVVDSVLAQERTIAELAGAFSLIAVVLACVGLYGVMSYVVTRRTGEVGIRMALGARGGDVVRLLMNEAVIIVLIGVAAGLIGALAVTRFTSSLLFGLTPTDPWTIAMASGLMIVVAVCAAYLPARRAARVDPLVALRHDC